MNQYKIYRDLIGLSKNQTMLELGNELNYYASDRWTYLLKTNWLGKKTFLVVLFDKDIVIKIEIKSTFRNNV